MKADVADHARAPKRPVVIATEIPIREDGAVRIVLRALEELSRGHDVTLRLAVRRDDTTAFNPCHAIQELRLADRVVYLPFFDNADLPDVLGDADIWLETQASSPSANTGLAMQTGVVVAGPKGLPVPVNCFWDVSFERADQLAMGLAALLADRGQVEALKLNARQYVNEHLPFSCGPVTHVSAHQERIVHGWYTNQHFVLFIASWRPDASRGPSGLTKRWVETIHALGCRIICIYYDLQDRSPRSGNEHGAGTGDDCFRDCIDHYFRVPATSAHAGHGVEPYDLHVDDWCGSELTLKVQEICNTYSVGVCVVQGAYLSRVLDRMPERIRRVLAIDSAFEDGRFVTVASEEQSPGQPVSLTVAGERTACSRADVILTKSDEEHRLHQALAPSREVLCWDMALQPAGDLAQTMGRVLWSPFAVPDSARPHFLHYHDVTMKYLSRFVRSFSGQVMLEVGPDDHLALARSVLANGAEKVIGVQTTERAYDDLPDRLQFAMVSQTRWEGVEDDSIDVVYGVGVLEHITHIEDVVDEIARVLKPGGRVFLQGCPMWGSAHGHHVVVFDSATGHLKYDFTRPDQNPLDSWAHLGLTEDQIRDELLAKQVPECDVGDILAMVFGEGIGSNRKMPGEIIAAFRRRLQTEAVRYLDAGERNRHYRAAEQRFPEKELLTDTLLIYARKPTRASAPPGGQRPLVSVIVPLSRLLPIMRRGLESVATQTYTDLEIWLVADGLPGSSLAVAEEYVGVDSRFRLLPASSTRGHDGGVSGAVERATGKHVVLYDGDTTLECRAIETFVLSRCLPVASINPSGLSDLGPASL